MINRYNPPVRVGIGYDVHRLVKDRDLILGGIKLDYDYGLSGHSDADVLTHAIMDSILGGLALGDIGEIFPDTDPKYSDISSIALLTQIGQEIKKVPYRIGNIDANIIAQEPKITPYKKEMRECIAKCLEISSDQVSIKATTEEGLGFTGTGEAIAAQAITTLILKESMKI